jgi:hypothetical protein
LKAIHQAISERGFEFVRQRTAQYRATYTAGRNFIPDARNWFANGTYANDPDTWRGCQRRSTFDSVVPASYANFSEEFCG